MKIYTHLVALIADMVLEVGNFMAWYSALLTVNDIEQARLYNKRDVWDIMGIHILFGIV